MGKSVFVMAGILAVMIAAAAFAGSLNAPSAPGATNSYKVDDIYNRLNNGTTGAQGTFTPPSGAIVGTGHTLNEVMGKAPAKDDSNGAVPADVKAGKTFWGLNKASGKWGPQSARFTDNGNGTVKDNLTGLIWLTNANCWGAIKWATALANASGLKGDNTMCSLNDGSTAGEWRMPNIVELQSLIDFAYMNPVLTSGHPFSNLLSTVYWSATTHAVVQTAAWYVDMSNGRVDGATKTDSRYVLPVR